MLMTNRALGTFEHKVRAYVALTEFSRLKFIEGGLPEEKLFVKPNFLMRDPGLKSSGGDYAVFAGRLSEQKGLHTLLAAMARIPHIPIILAGDGPLFSKIKEQIDGKRLENVKLTGWLSPEDLRKKMRNARFLVMPSRSYENFPLNVLEAFAMGLPVVCSRLGAMKELVQDAFTGFHFEAGNPIDLAEKMLRAWDHDALKEIGRNARVQFERKYTADRNYEKLMAIYECALHGSLAGSAMQATVAS
jgi:glycosyltransferase involved in cell wall biosynthesis